MGGYYILGRLFFIFSCSAVVRGDGFIAVLHSGGGCVFLNLAFCSLSQK